MKNAYKKLVTIAILTACISLVGVGCNTSRGFGEDVEELGEEIQGD